MKRFYVVMKVQPWTSIVCDGVEFDWKSIEPCGWLAVFPEEEREKAIEWCGGDERRIVMVETIET